MDRRAPMKLARPSQGERWFGVRTVFEIAPGTYEERITLHKTPSFEEAIDAAERSGHEHAEILDYLDTGLTQGYWIADELEDGAKVFSLIRESELPPDEYILEFFRNGPIPNIDRRALPYTTSGAKALPLGGLTLMGARLYNPQTGRFLSVDPVLGGNSNAYTYPNDPVNMSDTTGMCGWVRIAKYGKVYTCKIKSTWSWKVVIGCVAGGASLAFGGAVIWKSGVKLVYSVVRSLTRYEKISLGFGSVAEVLCF